MKCVQIGPTALQSGGTCWGTLHLYPVGSSCCLFDQDMRRGRAHWQRRPVSIWTTTTSSPDQTKTENGRTIPGWSRFLVAAVTAIFMGYNEVYHFPLGKPTTGHTRQGYCHCLSTQHPRRNQLSFRQQMTRFIHRSNLLAGFYVDPSVFFVPTSPPSHHLSYTFFFCSGNFIRPGTTT